MEQMKNIPWDPAGKGHLRTPPEMRNPAQTGGESENEWQP
jgi:hypothetical protein